MEIFERVNEEVSLTDSRNAAVVAVTLIAFELKN